MRLPRQIDILSNMYKVSYSRRICRDRGSININRQTITVYIDGMSRTEIMQVLLHECVHAICYHLALPLDTNDPQVDQLTVGITDTIMRNQLFR
jgi:hypothetical protein